MVIAGEERILSLVVLNILSKGEFYGYELVEEIRRYPNIDVAEGTLYPLLIRLKEDNMVSSEWVEQESGIPRKYYMLTRDGEENLEEKGTAGCSENNEIDVLLDVIAKLGAPEEFLKPLVAGKKLDTVSIYPEEYLIKELPCLAQKSLSGRTRLEQLIQKIDARVVLQVEVVVQRQPSGVCRGK